MMLTNGEFQITEDLMISGGVLNLSIDGQDASRIFNIDTSETVSVSGLRLLNGHAFAEGGAIALAGVGTVNLTNLMIADNVANGNGGGGIYSSVANLTVDNTVFENNVADGPSGSGGGLLMNQGLATISDSQFNTNVANRAGGGIEITFGSMYLYSVDFTSNVAGPLGSANPGNGGALHVTGAAGSSVEISGGVIQHNVAAQEGGGLWNQAGATMVVRDGTNFFSNTAQGNAADDGGGAIFNNGGTLRVFDATFTLNKANGASGSGGAIFSAGGVMNIRNSTISANSAIRAGGGIEIFDGYAKLDDVTLGGAALADKNVAGPGGFGNPGNGGGLHVSGTVGTTVVIDGGSVQNNNAQTEGGGLWNNSGAVMIIRNGAAILGNIAFGDEADEGGGGIFNNGGTVTITNANISNNSASGIGASGGGLFSFAGSLTITNSSVSNNTAQRGGGGLEIVNGNVILQNTNISGNKAGFNNGANPGNGGGIHVADIAHVELRDSSVTSNTAAKQGGGIWNQIGSTLIVRNSTVSNNAAQGNSFGDGGGGIYSRGGIARVIDSTVSNNSASGTNGQGGGMLINSGILNVRDGSVISGNTAVRSGAGIEIVNGYSRMDDSTIGSETAGSGNTLSGPSSDGGGIHVTGGITGNYMLLNNMTIQNNSANRSGGGLWNQAGTTISVRGTSAITENTALGNSALDGGGGIYNHGGTVRLIGTTVSLNQASGLQASGGGIFSSAGILNLRNGTLVQGNMAHNFGGGIEVVDGYANIIGSTIGGSVQDANTARYGAGLHVSGLSNTTVILDNALVSYNEAEVSGGGLWNQNTSLMLLKNGTVVSFNTAKGIGTPQGGAGIFNRSGGTLFIQNSSVSNNVADGNDANGGGIYIDHGANATLIDADINGNSTREKGGGIFNWGTLTADSASRIFGNLARPRWRNFCRHDGDQSPQRNGGDLKQSQQHRIRVVSATRTFAVR